jgi:hypothetical protein
MAERYYPVGIQTFRKIIREGYLYIDKTDLIWHMQNKRSYVFLSRPRRFGKSLLSSTLHSFFAGEKELFRGLKIMELEKEWKQYPVIHLDLSIAKGKESANELRRTLILLLSRQDLYSDNPNEKTPGEKLTGMIQRVNRETGKQVVVIVDEYDAPLLEVLHDDETLDSMRRVMQEFYVPLKANEQYIKFCFITGITKFSQLSIFSTINNLTNISLWPQFSAICGITERELTTAMHEDIEIIAQVNDISWEQMHQKLKARYDGYHFSEQSEDIYNPFSLLKAFDSKRISSYWFESGTPTFLIRQMQHFGTNIMSLDSMIVPSSAFDKPTESMTSALPLLYQTGYLTIKDYDSESQEYTLALPNQEVRIGYTEGLLPTYIGLDCADVQSGFALKFWRALKKGEINLALKEMQSYMAGLPYVEGFKKKLEAAATKEDFYEYTMYLIFSMLNVYARTQVKCQRGRTDLVVWMPDTVYVFELKIDGSADDALNQIDDRSYAIPYKTDGKKVIKVGVKFDARTRVPEEWIIKEE